VWEGVVALGEV
jgi:hypothetical protein